MLLNIDKKWREYFMQRLVSQNTVQYIFGFDNGYGAYVTQSPRTAGYEFGLWEVAVLGLDGEIDYTTPVTNDVTGFCGDLEVTAVLEQIKNLK